MNHELNIVVYSGHNAYDVHGNSDETLNIRVPQAMIHPFKLMISRALNAWPDAHPALKDFGDVLEYGKPLQDYWSQRTDRTDKPLK